MQKLAKPMTSPSRLRISDSTLALSTACHVSECVCASAFSWLKIDNSCVDYTSVSELVSVEIEIEGISSYCLS